MSLSRTKYVMFFVIPVIILSLGFTIDDLPLDKEDQQKLEKAKKLNQEAQELYDKANILFSEIANLDISNPKNEKKANSLKEKAIDHQINALELQKDANYLEYNVFNRIKPELKSNYIKTNEIPSMIQLLEESANELYYKAEQLRNEAYNTDKEEKENRFAKLDEAQKFEKEGLEKQKEIIDIYLGKTVIEDKSQEKVATNENIELNEELLQTYKDFMEEEDSQTPMESIKELISSDSLSSSRLRSTWDEYLYEESEVAEKTSIDQDSISEIISKAVAEQYNESKVTTTSEVQTKHEELIEKNVIYKIQIAADKKPLSQNVLSKIYAGKKEIKMINEDGWNKYSIGDFNTFAEADEYRKQIGAGEAFVVGYENGVKVDLLANNNERKTSRNNNKVNSNLPKGLIFKVQISADKKKMSEISLKNLYQGSEQIDLIEEDGWYKYSVGKLSTYENAINLKKTVKAKGSFIVAYHNGVKISLHAAKSGKVSDQTSNENIVFRVQIAADTKTLSSEFLHNIYSGYEKVNKHVEDGWHKYALGEFNTFDEANKFRAKSGVKGAFVIAFRAGEKINVLAAKNMKRCFDPIIISDWLSKNNQLIYKVQIAASGRKLSENQIKSICCIESNVYLTEEDNWFKYSIGNFENYQNAVNMKEESGVEGAFIIVYKNGEKLSLSKALNMSK